MGVGYVPEEDRPPGLAGLDVDAAAQGVADVYGVPDRLKQLADMGLTPEVLQQADGGPSPEQLQQIPGMPQLAAPVDAVPGREAQQGGSDPSGVHAPEEAGSTPAPATENAGGAPGISPPTLQPLPPPPAPPQLTGDPAKDIQANTLYQRALTDYHGQLVQHHQAVTTKAAGVEAEKARREAVAARAVEVQREEERKRYAAERLARQSEIDRAVQERAAAAKDIEGATWTDQHTGAAIFATIGGAIAQGMANASAALLGQAGHAQNEGVNTIAKLMDRERATREKRLQMAGSAVQEARYGFKDAADNYRAAMNDLDADQASKWRLIAKETESELRRLGADRAAIEQNDLYATALQKAAAEEGKIHEREEARNISREHARATESLARASLAVRRDEAGAKRDDKAEQKDTETSVFDTKTGEKLGNAPTRERAKIAEEALSSIQNARDDALALKEHVQQQGMVAPSLPLIGPPTEAGRTRKALAEGLVTRLSSFKNLGAIAKEDRKIVDGVITGGVSYALGLNVPQLEKLEKALDKAQENALKSQGIRPKVAPAASPTAKPAGGAPQPVIDQAWRAVQDPKAPAVVKQKAMQVLTDSGQL